MISSALVLLLLPYAGASKRGDDVEHLKDKDRQGFDAIANLHKSMDDDSSGSIDLSESTDFLREELHVKDKDPLARRQQTFHHNNDESITVDDLWERWIASTEYKWTVDDIIDWLVRYVELPQYVDVFIKNSVDGSRLPRLAAQNTSYLQTVLGITNPVHRQKLQLKATDVVLFGYRGSKPNYAKDVLLVALLVVAVAAYWFAIYQRKTSEKQARALTSQLDKLKDMEQEFIDLQNKLEEERRQESCKASVTDEEIENKDELLSLKYQLKEAERLREKRNPLLQSLLRKSYEIEIARINEQKLESLKEMNEARELVEKLRRKQSSLLNQIRSVHGAEEIDERIVMVRQKMEKTARAIEECEQRWLEIEYLAGFKIINVPLGPARIVSSGPLSSVGGYSRPQFYGSGALELENDGGGVSVTDIGGPQGQINDAVLRGLYMHPNRQQLSGTSSSSRVTQPSNVAGGSRTRVGNSPTGVGLPNDVTAQLHRATFNLAGSDMIRSASAGDLLASGNASSTSADSNGSPLNELVHSNSATSAGQVAARRIQQHVTLDEVGKKSSQLSMGESANVGKQKKKLLKFFGSGRDKRE